MRTARQAAVVGVQTSHMTRAITPRGGTLDLLLLWPTAVWKSEERKDESDDVIRRSARLSVKHAFHTVSAAKVTTCLNNIQRATDGVVKFGIVTTISQVVCGSWKHNYSRLLLLK